MAQSEDPSFSPESTRRLFISLFWLIIVLPVSAGAAIFAAFYLLGIPFDRKSMKLAILVIWLGTLACLTFFALRNRRGRPSDDNGRIFRTVPSASPADKWEQRKARRLGARVYLLAVVLPAAGAAIAWVVLLLIGSPMRESDISTVALSAWGTGVAVAVFYALRSRRDVFIFRGGARADTEQRE